MKVYKAIWRYMKVYGGIWRYMEVYASIWTYVACARCAGGCGGGGRINAHRALPPGSYENASNCCDGDGYVGRCGSNAASVKRDKVCVPSPTVWPPSLAFPDDCSL